MEFSVCFGDSVTNLGWPLGELNPPGDHRFGHLNDVISVRFAVGGNDAGGCRVQKNFSCGAILRSCPLMTRSGAIFASRQGRRDFREGPSTGQFGAEIDAGFRPVSGPHSVVNPSDNQSPVLGAVTVRQAAALNARSIKTARGGAWHSGTISRLLCTRGVRCRCLPRHHHARPSRRSYSHKPEGRFSLRVHRRLPLPDFECHHVIALGAGASAGGIARLQ